MSDPSSASQNANFSQGVNANSSGQFNLSFPPPQQQQQQQQQQQFLNNNGGFNPNAGFQAGINPQFMFQNGGFTPGPPGGGMNGQNMGLGGQANGNQPPLDQAALQARMALAQQMAQAGMQHHSQQEQKANGAGGSGHERKSSGPGPTGGPGAGTGAGAGQDWSQLANAANANPGVGGMMQNVQATTREALMKQLQALQSSHAAATRNRLGSGSGLGQSPPAPSPGLTNNSHPSPITHQSPLHPDNQIGQSPVSAINSATIRAPSFDGSQARPGSSGGGPGSNQPAPPFQPSTPSSTTAPGPPMRSTSGPAAQPQTGSPAAASPSTPVTAGTIPIRPPGVVAPGVRPALPMGEQRRQFLQSLVNWHKSHNITPPPEIFNSERSGAIKVGETWVEVVELFLTVLRVGGIDRVTKLPPDSPFWQGFFKAKGIANPLPTPVTLPSSPKSADQPQESTTDPVRFLIRAYMVWLYGFEQHMNTSKMALAQRQQAKLGTQQQRPPPSAATAPSPAQSQAPVDPSSTPQAVAPSPAPTNAATPAMPTAPTPTQPSASTPIASAPTPQGQPPTPNQPYPPLNYAQTPNMPPHMATPQSFAQPYPSAQSSTSTFPGMPNIPPPIQVDTQVPQSSTSHAGTPKTARGTGAKRGRKRKDANATGTGSTTTSRGGTPGPTPVSSAPPPVPQPVVDVPVERPKTPKRARYKVEYRPLHLPQNHLAGWDDRAVQSTFPKNNLAQPARSIHELGIVDMEAVLMGLRSRLPREVSYALTVLSMLSMGSPEENVHGLPLTAIPEIYDELLELLSEAAFGEDGYDAWSRTAPAQSDLNDMTFGELEQVGRDFDFGIDDERKDSTGGQTDIVLTCLNLLRNLSMLPENTQLMSHHAEVFELLSNLSDERLCRMPTSLRPTTAADESEILSSTSSTTAVTHHQPYSLYELARVRRDIVTVLSNLGNAIELTHSSSRSLQQTIKVISSFLSSGWAGQSAKESLYGPYAHHHHHPSQPPPLVSQHSVNRAVEAFCKLSWSDSNREALSKLPAEQLVEIFESLLKLLPVQRGHFDLLYSSEEYLGQTECLALSLYSLAFLAPLPTRSVMRNVPGGISVITRIIFDLSRRGPDFRSNPYAVLVRRLAETLGILNGTTGLESDDSLLGMSFGAGITGSGAKTSGGANSKVVERGWLAEHEEKVMEAMGIRGIDVPAFIELDNLWWAGGD